MSDTTTTDVQAPDEAWLESLDGQRWLERCQRTPDIALDLALKSAFVAGQRWGMKAAREIWEVKTND